MGKNKSKIPKQGAPVIANKLPSSQKVKINLYELIPIWSFKYCDFEHDKWGFCKSCKIHDIEQVLIKLQAYEGQNWGQILTDKSGRNHNTKNHPMPISHIIKEAQERLLHLNFDLAEEIYSLTINGETRLWGIIDDISGIFQVIWVDGEHEICPSIKSH
jgi:hypothetical protein